jgi:hypothetical protein
MGIVFGRIEPGTRIFFYESELAVLHKIQFFIKVKNAQHW